MDSCSRSNHNRGSLEGETFSVFLYTYTPDHQPLAVGVIRDLHVPRVSELAEVAATYRERGWLRQMEEDLEALGISGELISKSPPEELANVRFMPESVTLFDPLLQIPPSHLLGGRGRYRYQAYKWDGKTGVDGGGESPKSTSTKSRKQKTVTQWIRAAQEHAIVDPRHNRLQNALFSHLQSRYTDVRYEEDHVDLRYYDTSGWCLIEVKIAATARQCIREALGQLTEYAHYPSKNTLPKLLVVGDAPVTPDDIQYLNLLRAIYNLPLHYARWDWETQSLAEDV